MILSQGQEEEILSGNSLWQRKPNLFSLEDQKDLNGMLSKNLQEEPLFDNEEESLNITSDQQRLKRLHLHQVDSTQCNELASGGKQQQQRGSTLINFQSSDETMKQMILRQDKNLLQEQVNQSISQSFFPRNQPALNARQFEGDISIEGGSRINPIWKNPLGLSCDLDDKNSRMLMYHGQQTENQIKQTQLQDRFISGNNTNLDLNFNQKNKNSRFISTIYSPAIAASRNINKVKNITYQDQQQFPSQKQQLGRLGELQNSNNIGQQEQRIHNKVMKFCKQLLNNIQIRNKNLTRFQLNLIDDQSCDAEQFFKKPIKLQQQKTCKTPISPLTSDSQSIVSLSNHFKTNQNQSLDGFLQHREKISKKSSFYITLLNYFSIKATTILEFLDFNMPRIQPWSTLRIFFDAIILIYFTYLFIIIALALAFPQFDWIFSNLLNIGIAIQCIDIFLGFQTSLFLKGILCKIPSYYIAFKRLSRIIIHSLTIGWIILAKHLQESKYSWIQQVSVSSSSSISDLLNSSPQILYLASLQTIISHLFWQGWRQMTPYEQLFMLIVQITSIFIIMILLKSMKIEETIKINSTKQPLKNGQSYIFSYLARKQISESLFQKICHFLEYNSSSHNSSHLPIEYINAINMKLSPSLRQQLQTKTNIKILEKSSFMLQFGHNFCLAIAKHLQQQTYSPGEIIYFEGEQADDYIYFTEEGTIELFHVAEKYNNNEEKNHLVFETINSGSSFGELGFITGQPRESFARCSKEASIFKHLLETLKQLSRDLFLGVLQDKDFRNQKEKFCQLRDDLLTKNKTAGTFKQHLFSNCSACKSSGHSISTCNQIHFNSDRELLALRSCYEESNTQKRQVLRKFQFLQPTIQIMRHHRAKQNAWALQNQAKISAEKIEDCSQLFYKCINDMMTSDSQNYHNSTEQDCLQEHENQQYNIINNSFNNNNQLLKKATRTGSILSDNNCEIINVEQMYNKAKKLEDDDNSPKQLSQRGKLDSLNQVYSLFSEFNQNKEIHNNMIEQKNENNFPDLKESQIIIPSETQNRCNIIHLDNNEQATHDRLEDKHYKNDDGTYGEADSILSNSKKQSGNDLLKNQHKLMLIQNLTPSFSKTIPSPIRKTSHSWTHLNNNQLNSNNSISNCNKINKLSYNTHSLSPKNNSKSLGSILFVQNSNNNLNSGTSSQQNVLQSSYDLRRSKKIKNKMNGLSEQNDIQASYQSSHKMCIDLTKQEQSIVVNSEQARAYNKQLQFDSMCSNIGFELPSIGQVLNKQKQKPKSYININDLNISNNSQFDRSFHGQQQQVYSIPSNNLEFLQKIQGRLWKHLAISKILKGNNQKSIFEFVYQVQKDSQSWQMQNQQQLLQLESIEEFQTYKPHNNATKVLRELAEHQVGKRNFQGNGFYQYLLAQKKLRLN